ncbi:LysR family transcriptional regulator [Thalassospira marina]|uniref:LysR family transcriptional regulator n=1 Tax=Thalassospira marina TaxID=2048283 RepID=A0A2N3KBW6_9PROT|nr:LysR family transcriptional regulator [Thalassospira marina]PKR48052.1 LysR family transcriptional regulator [Thalassospira marina]
MLDLEIFLLRSFVAVSRAGSISEAAQQIGRTQSAVSMQMQRLEDAVGQPVLRRTGAGVELTAAGIRMLSYAERILGAHDEAVAAISGTALHGAISIGCPEDYMTAFFPGLLRRFASLHGGIEIEVVCAGTVELRRLLQRRQIDLALLSVPEDADRAQIIRPESFVWVGNSPEPAIIGREVLPLALSAPGTLDHEAAIGAMDRVGRAYRIAFASNSLAGLLAVTRSGEAISVVTRAAVPPDLFILQENLPALPDIGITLAYAALKPPPIVETFGEFIKSYLSDI